MGFIFWVTAGAIVSGHQDAVRESHEHIEADYQRRIDAAPTQYAKEVLILARQMWRDSRPVPTPKWP
jgi:hypothetical protein